ncbi:MAG: hypothetical protein OXI51_06745 [Chloroflexota bacterium]|nr:hypothetical protein [Chloroflexota bacterium]
MKFGPNLRGVRAQMQQEARKHATDRNRIDPHARSHGEMPLEEGRRLYRIENPSRLRVFWRIWEFVFGRGRIRVGG